jgi:putative tricarboxylic transport membrane protein
MIKIKRDQIAGALLVIAGVVVTILVSQFSTPMTASYPGPKLMPLIAAFGLVVCGGGIFIIGTIKKGEEEPFLLKEGWMKIAVTAILLIVYVLCMKYLGYLISTPILLFVLSTLFAKGNKASLKARIIFSVGFTIALYIIYVYLFGLSFPTGLLFE